MKEEIVKTENGEYLLSPDVVDRVDENGNQTSEDVVSLFFRRTGETEEWESVKSFPDFESARAFVGA